MLLSKLHNSSFDQKNLGTLTLFSRAEESALIWSAVDSEDGWFLPVGIN